jgi:hypothetical protein
MKTYGGVEVYIHVFLTSTLVGGDLFNINGAVLSVLLWETICEPFSLAGPVAGYCEYGTEHSGSINIHEIPEYLNG